MTKTSLIWNLLPVVSWSPSPRGPQARVSFPRFTDFSHYSGLPTPGASPRAGRSHVLCYLILTTSLQGSHWSRGEAHGGHGLGNWTLLSIHVACAQRVHSAQVEAELALVFRGAARAHSGLSRGHGTQPGSAG